MPLSKSLLILALLTCSLPGVNTFAQTQLPDPSAISPQQLPSEQPTALGDLQQPSQIPPILEQTQTVGAPLAQVTSLPSQQPPTSPTEQPAFGPPFQLDAVEQQFVDQILQMWENEGAKIKTYDCHFERWEYDPVFGPTNDPSIKCTGQLTYAKPDKGSFKIDDIQRFVQKDPEKPGEYVLQKDEVGEHWVCDGKAIYEYKHEKKQLVVQALPEDMRGKSIVDGPLPFLFGAEAAKLKARYWIRSRQSSESEIWLEAYPRTQADAANYHHVDVMLERKTMMPRAIQVHMPNGRNRAVYMFEKPSVNGALNQLFGALFNSPRTPLGWTRVVEELPSAPQATQPAETQLK